MSVARLLRRILVLALLVVLVAAVVATVWVLTHRDDARAWRQAATIGGALSGGSIGARGAELLGRETESVTVEEAGSLPARLVAPRGARIAPAIVILVPSGTSDAEDADVIDAQHAIATSGLMAWAVRVPPTDELLGDEAAGTRVIDAIDDVATHSRTRASRVSVLAVGPTASIVLHAAGTGDLDLRAIVAVQPIADAHGLLRRALTDPSLDPALRQEAGRALARAAGEQADEASVIVTELLDAAVGSDDPIAALRLIPPRLAPDSLGAVFDVIRAEDREEFDAAWVELPDALREAVERQSPLAVAGGIDARVLLVDDPGESRATREDLDKLGDALGDARMTISPTASTDVDELDLLKVSAWWLRRAGS